MNKGFTLIELIIVFTIGALLAVFSIASFNEFNKSQITISAASDVAAQLNTARSRALSTVKPSQCNNQVLNGYKVVITNPSGYELDVVCSGNSYVIDKRTLPTDVMFTSPSTQILFASATGVVTPPVTVNISGNGKSKSITVSAAGLVTLQ